MVPDWFNEHKDIVVKDDQGIDTLSEEMQIEREQLLKELRG